MHAKLEKTVGDMTHGSQLPQFSSDTLLNLTQKIESSLKKQTNGAVSKASVPKPKKIKGKVGESNGSPTLKAPKPRTSIKLESNGHKTAGSKQEKAAAPKLNQGKKRSRDGKVKEPGDLRKKDNVNGIKLGPRVQSANHVSDIEEDIRALGVTKEDIDLVADAASDSELEDVDGGTAGPDLKKELHQLIRQLGVDTTAQQNISDVSESEEEMGDQRIAPENLERMKSAAVEANGVIPSSQATRKPGKKHLSLVFQAQSEWHAVALPAIDKTSNDKASLPQDLLEQIHIHAKSLLEKENEEYAAHSTTASFAHQFYSTIMSTGTLSDKISALTLSVQESPVHNLKALESLVGLARKRSRGQAVDVLGALKDLFGPGNLLPSDRKLKTFASQPGLTASFNPTGFRWVAGNLLPKPLKEIHLIVWAYEDWLKTTFFEVLKIIETWCNDEVVFARGKAVDYVCQLLKEKPEQEANLLRLLVNKLGDSDKKIASKTSYNILQLETTHPLMKPTIISAIESDILFRPGQSLHAKYYATITLNQTVLSGREEGVATKLLEIYFSLFIKLLEKPTESKPAAGTGPNSIVMNKKGELQGGGGSAGRKAQKKLAEHEKTTTVGEDLQEKMLSAVLTGVNRAIPFTNTNDESFERHLDTLFRVTHSSNFNTSIQALMLIQQLNESHQGSVDRFYRTLYESLLDPRLLTSSKQALYLNLLFRALRSDLNVKRVKAFAKRLLQVVAMHQPSFTCGTLYLLRELEGVFANLEAFIDQPEEDNDDEEESFRDVQEITANGHNTENSNTRRNGATDVTSPTKSQCYDGRKRDPEYSNASRSALWELIPFLTHYHPSVSLFATRLLTHEPMPPKPDLSLNTLIHFLDRFVYRNPKTTTTHKGASIMQPMAGSSSSALLVSAYSSKERSRAPVNSEAFWKQESGKVGADEVFFHKYFSTLGRGREKAKKKKEERKKGDDASESGADEDEDEIWKALVESRPELDEGSESGFSDMDDLEDEESDGGVEFNDDDDDDEVEINAKKHPIATEVDPGDDESLNLDSDSDDEAQFDSDDLIPDELEHALEKEPQGAKKKGDAIVATREVEKRGAKRRRLKNLPTFASAEDYAKMLDGDD